MKELDFINRFLSDLTIRKKSIKWISQEKLDVKTLEFWLWEVNKNLGFKKIFIEFRENFRNHVIPAENEFDVARARAETPGAVPDDLKIGNQILRQRSRFERDINSMRGNHEKNKIYRNFHRGPHRDSVCRFYSIKK